MRIEHTVAFLTGLLILAIAIQPLARRLHIPFTAILVIAGFGISEVMVMAGLDTGIRAQNFHDLIFFVFLPILIFESAYRIDTRLLLKNLVPILFLAIPLMLLSALITAALVYAGIAHPAGFPWIAALLSRGSPPC
jgi:CPA1 family monovalent cation:H+ antiporter